MIAQDAAGSHALEDVERLVWQEVQELCSALAAAAASGGSGGADGTGIEPQAGAGEVADEVGVADRGLNVVTLPDGGDDGADGVEERWAGAVGDEAAFERGKVVGM